MPFAPSLVKKILASTASVSVFAYGSYCIYALCSGGSGEELDYILVNWKIPTNGPIVDYRQKPFYEKIGGNWSCTKGLFKGINPPNTDNVENRGTTSSSVPTSSNATYDTRDSIGCLSVFFDHVKDTNKKGAFIKWELALRSGNRGFIYVGFLSTGMNAGNYSVGEAPQWESYSMIFEVAKEGEEWDTKGGLYWSDFLTSSTFSQIQTLDNTTISISFPNEKKWESSGTVCFPNGSSQQEKCPAEQSTWSSEGYFGFWEQGYEGQQVTDAINIEVKEKGNGGEKTYKHDIWQTPDFDFSNSNQSISGDQKLQFPWSITVAGVYDTAKKLWNSVDNNSSAQNYLKAIYSPWVKKKGTWKEASDVCSRSRRSKSDKYFDLCYQKKISKPEKITKAPETPVVSTPGNL